MVDSHKVIEEPASPIVCLSLPEMNSVTCFLIPMQKIYVIFTTLTIQCYRKFENIKFYTFRKIKLKFHILF